MAIRSENPAHHPAGWTVKKGRWFLEGASTECLRLGLGWRPTPNEKLFIFDIQNAMAGLFFFHHHLRGEERREGKRGGEGGSLRSMCPDFRYIFRPSSLPRSRSLCLWPHFPPFALFAGHLRAAPHVTLSPYFGWENGSTHFPIQIARPPSLQRRQIQTS